MKLKISLARVACAICVSGFVLGLSACDVANNGPAPSTGPSPVAVTLNPISTSDFYALDNRISDVTLNLGPLTRDVYVTYTNTNASSAVKPSITNSSVSAAAGSKQASMMTDIQNSYARNLSIATAPAAPHRDPTFVTNSRQKLADLVASNRSNQSPASRSVISVPHKTSFSVGDHNLTFHGHNNSGDVTVPVTLRSAVTGVTTAANGTRNVYIWVADSAFTGAASPSQTKLVTQTMVDALAAKFLDASNNDIYDWDTEVFGGEWGSTNTGASNGLIDFTGDIHIFLWDIDSDNSTNGGTVGFFWGEDNFLDGSDGNPTVTSNQLLNFSIDSVLFAQDDGGTWDLTNYWPEEVVSTLAHEFQHMIQFYQKVVKKPYSAHGFDTWIDEMLAMLAEDMVADKLSGKGPRGVLATPTPSPTSYSAGSSSNQYGRLPLYDYEDDVSLTLWNYNFPTVLQNYSISYAFGAYLLRQRGGIATLQSMYANSLESYDSVAAAVSAVEGQTVSFGDIMRDWAAATLLSNNPHGVPSSSHSYNNGSTNPFVLHPPSAPSSTYNVGSINMYNYALDFNNDGLDGSDYYAGPWYYTNQASIPSLLPNSNTYFRLGASLTGTQKFRITVPAGVKVGIVLK